MKQSLTDVFSYLKIEFSDQDLTYFSRHYLATKDHADISNNNEDLNSYKITNDFDEIYLNKMVCNSDGILCFIISVPRILSAEQILFLEKKL
ncbi:MAG: hypothetical protein GX328_03180, partial [Clostridiaceae bacterium]|nr:hypothetical protein [Clostridiaceae bacterium]